MATGPDCASYPYATPEHSIGALMAGLSPIIETFPSLQAALEARRPAICLKDQGMDALGFLEVSGKRIVLDIGLRPGLQKLILLHELRHLDQMHHGACPTPELSMRANALAVMAMEADASAVSMLAAWFLREQGDPAAWRAALAWPSQADIARSFETVMNESGDLAAATSVAFSQWFESDTRRESYYIAACSDYTEAQDRTKRVPQYRALPNEFWQGLCRLPDGARYRCDAPKGNLR